MLYLTPTRALSRVLSVQPFRQQSPRKVFSSVKALQDPNELYRQRSIPKAALRWSNRTSPESPQPSPKWIFASFFLILWCWQQGRDYFERRRDICPSRDHPLSREETLDLFIQSM